MALTSRELRIWLLTQRLPYAPNRGDRIRSYNILQFLRRRAEVDVFSLVHDEAERSSTALMDGDIGVVSTAYVPKWRNRVKAALRLPTEVPTTLSLLNAPELTRSLAQNFTHRRPDVVLAYCSSMAAYAMSGPLSQVPMVLDMVDVDSQKWRALADVSSGPKRLIFEREARCLRTFEHAAMRAASVTVAVNEREVAALRQINPDATVMPVENGISLEEFAPPHSPQESSTVVFCGVMNYGPNEEAALRLIHRIWPKIIDKRPDARLLLVGMNPTSRLRAAAAGQPTIEITGAVEDVRPYLWQSALSAVPLTVARGIQNKVLEALAAGLPTVVTPMVSAGLPSAVLCGTAVAESDEEFAGVILRWLDESACARRARAESSDLRSLAWERQLQPLWDAIQGSASIARDRVEACA